MLDLISDIYKDAYGFRPSGQYMVKWNELSLDERELEWARLTDMVEENLLEEKKETNIAILEFEKAIIIALEAGASDRDTAIRWMLDVEGLLEDNNDTGYICWMLGLPYHILSLL